MDFQEIVNKEQKRANKKGDFNSFHEAYGILLEEVEEYWEEVKKRNKYRDIENVKHELAQIIAVCYKTYESLIQEKPSDS